MCNRSRKSGKLSKIKESVKGRLYLIELEDWRTIASVKSQKLTGKKFLASITLRWWLALKGKTPKESRLKNDFIIIKSVVTVKHVMHASPSTEISAQNRAETSPLSEWKFVKSRSLQLCSMKKSQPINLVWKINLLKQIKKLGWTKKFKQVKSILRVI